MTIRIKVITGTGIIIVLALIMLTFFFLSRQNSAEKNMANGTPINQGLVFSNTQTSQGPIRDWSILDPAISSEAALIQSLDDGFSFFNYGTYRVWPMASLTKLLTAVIVTEDIGLNTKISITKTALETDGLAGDLKSGEVYTARDLAKIMLMVSSNDAAAAFEEYVGGKEVFVNMMRQKAKKIGMRQTVVNDASGLDDNNTTTASDMLKLIKYILEKDPNIISWTQLQTFPIQPTNDTRSRVITNIDPLVIDPGFLGGKTGTSPKAKENLAAIFSFANKRIAIIILGSADRIKEIHNLLDWVKRAYNVQ